MQGWSLHIRNLTRRSRQGTRLKRERLISSYCTDTKEELEGYGFHMIKEYAEIPLVVAMKEDKTLNEVDVLTTVPYLESEAAAVFNLEEVNLEFRDTQQECLDAVGKGTADAVLCDGYLSEYLMGTELSYSGMKIKSVLSREHNISIAVKDDSKLLAGILSKMVDVIDARQSVNTC